MSEKTRAVVLLSGGMDSTTALYHSVGYYDYIEAISFDYGQNHKKELELAKWHCEHLGIEHTIIKLDFSCFNSSLLSGADAIPEGHYEDESMKSTVVPFRNGIMLAYAVGYAENIGADVVIIGSHAGDHAVYPDCRKEFTHFMSCAAHEGTYNKIIIDSPFNAKMKWDIVKIGTGLKIDYSKTWSCYKGHEKPCGKCGTCVERIEAFVKNNLIDPAEYE